MKSSKLIISTLTLVSSSLNSYAQKEKSPFEISWENLTRLEARENTFDFNDAVDHPNDDTFLLNRFRFAIAAKPNDFLTFYIQAQDTQELGSQRDDVPGQLGAEGDDSFDLRQCYVQLGQSTDPFSFTLGRQALSYGDQRLIGPLEWSALSRTFDAAKIHWNGASGTWIDAFVSSAVVAERGVINQSNDDSIFSGLYGHMPLTNRDDAEAYLLHKYDRNRGEDFFTLGARFKSVPKSYGAWDYEAEFVYQQGDVNDLNLQAYACYMEVGYTLTEISGTPRISLEYSFGSGDDNATDNHLGSFQNLYPTNHPHYGFMDAFSWSNMHDVCLHSSIKPSTAWTISADLHAFWLADTSDSWKRANNVSTVRPINAQADSFAGLELDLLSSYKINEHVSMALGYTHFFAGAYLNDTGADDDADFSYLSTQWTF